MALIVKRRFSLAKSPDAFVVDGDCLWVAGGAGNCIQGYSYQSGEDLNVNKTLTLDFIADGGITKRGNTILSVTAKDRILFSIDPQSGKKNEILDLKTLNGGNNTGALRAVNSRVTDISWYDKTMWIAVEGGYSSCIIEIDVDRKTIVNDFWAPSPKPFGLECDKDGKRLWVLEGRTGKLIDIDRSGNLLGAELDIPVENVRYLSIDNENNFWTVDAQRAFTYCLGREE